MTFHCGQGRQQPETLLEKEKRLRRLDVAIQGIEFNINMLKLEKEGKERERDILQKRLLRQRRSMINITVRSSHLETQHN